MQNSSVSLTSAGGNLDLLDAIRGQGRRKSQAEMLRDQSMTPVEVGNYNGIQSSFPMSQGFNKIAQGILSGYMESDAKEKAQAESDRQIAEANKLVENLTGKPAVAAQPGVDAQPGTAPMPGDTVTESPQDAQQRITLARGLMVVPPDQASPVDPSQPTTAQGQAQGPLPAPMPGQRMETLPGMGAPDDPGVVGRDAVAAQASTVPDAAQRQRLLLAAALSPNGLMNQAARHVSDQDAIADQKKEAITSREFIAKQQRDLIAANHAAAAAQSQPARDEQQRLIKQDKQHRGEAATFASAYKAATPEDQRKMLVDAQFSGNPYLTKGATHIGDMDLKATLAAEKAKAKDMEVPPRVLDQYNTNLTAYKTTARTVDQIDQSLGRLADGSLKFDIINNTTDSARNMVGATSEQSRNKAEYQNDILRLANEVLVQAKGTQTEGDARRALTQIQGNINDPIVVRTQLEKLRRIATDAQNTAATTLNISGKAHPGLDHAPVSMAIPLADRTPVAKPIQALPQGMTNEKMLSDAMEHVSRTPAARAAVEKRLNLYGLSLSK